MDNPLGLPTENLSYLTLVTLEILGFDGKPAFVSLVTSISSEQEN